MLIGREQHTYTPSIDPSDFGFDLPEIGYFHQQRFARRQALFGDKAAPVIRNIA
jgi:hypothetical protein